MKYSRLETVQVVIAEDAQVEGLETNDKRQRMEIKNLLDLIYPL